MLREALITAGAATIGLGLALTLLANWLEYRPGWPTSGSWLRFGKVWGTMGLVVALVGGACLVTGCVRSAVG